eukprot:COSAG04_NODE_10841_length_749_cov_1.193846_1_plen_201_part_01
MSYDDAQEAAGAIRRARAASNEGFAAQDPQAIAQHWLPGMLVTQATLGEHTLGADANVAMLAEMFATRADVNYQRTPTRVAPALRVGFSAEEGRWEGSWRDADGRSAGKSGVYFAQWQAQPNSGGWLLRSEVFVPVAASAEPGAAEAERQIRQHRAASNAAILAHDIEGIVEHWLPDVHVTHSSGDVIGGADANRQMFAES